MEKNVLLVVNPISGDLDKQNIIDQSTAYVRKINKSLIVYVTTGYQDALKIQSIYEQHSPEHVLVAGGDGTIKMVAEALETRDVVFGILPAGSANGLATDIGLPETITDCLEIAFGTQFSNIDMIDINGKRSLHLSDVGINATLIKNYEENDVRGKLGYALQVFNTLLVRDEPFIATIETNGQKMHFSAYMIVIANSKKYGTGVTINPDGLLDDGKFELVILKNLDLIIFTKIVTGITLRELDEVEIISTTAAKISLNRNISFQIDGEYCGLVNKLEIGVAKSKMRVAVPLVVI